MILWVKISKREGCIIRFTDAQPPLGAPTQICALGCMRYAFFCFLSTIRLSSDKLS